MNTSIISPLNQPNILNEGIAKGLSTLCFSPCSYVKLTEALERQCIERVVLKVGITFAATT